MPDPNRSCGMYQTIRPNGPLAPSGMTDMSIFATSAARNAALTAPTQGNLLLNDATKLGTALTGMDVRGSATFRKPADAGGWVTSS